MDWSFVGQLLMGAFYTSRNVFVALPTYLAIVPILVWIFAPKWGASMKKLTKKKQAEKSKQERIANARRLATIAVIILLFVSLILSANNLYKNKTPKFATPSELMSPVLSGLNIRMTDLVPVYSEPIVSGKVFQDNNFYGPAVLSIRANNKIDGLCIITEAGVTADTAIIYTPNEEYIGAIILDGNIFKGINKLHNISIITNSQDVVNQMREELRKSIEQLEK
jgi:hypothetical protein